MADNKIKCWMVWSADMESVYGYAFAETEAGALEMGREIAEQYVYGDSSMRDCDVVAAQRCAGLDGKQTELGFKRNEICFLNADEGGQGLSGLKQLGFARLNERGYNQFYRNYKGWESANDG